MSKWLTSRELMTAVGLTGHNTLVRYHKAGLIPPPDLRKHPSGRGMTSYWEEWVVLRLQRIKRLSDAGKTRKEIKEFLGTDWDAAKTEFEGGSRSRNKREQLSESKNRLAAARKLNALVSNLMQGWGALLKKPIPFDAEMLDHCIELLQEGLRPVLVLQNGQVFVTCDTAVAFHSESYRRVNEAFAVIPLTHELSDLLGTTARIDPQAEAMLVRKIEKSEREREVTLMDGWAVEVGPGNRKAKSKRAVPRQRRKRSRVITPKKN